ncbi:Dolichyl-diphosphooligosaccharide--protein glycosyltransferase subunit 1 [Grifola frondosa]|uniref:Dolichyl-diphosphooligosaccharide--protein glycosyltransferase subunit 1 n=1 Tax=Grifola frondosa TaxID=5627 RepID=A0A1C7M0I7_GRIFR|nr:Dolichyl-diphosphooligosaccharide--protein glycosyltransferase subunit 1 [Grifola frondosa]
MGGWNYSFTLGWDSPLRDYAGWDKTSGRYIIGVPLMTVIPGTVIDDADIKIILPEGATDIEYFPPFPALEEGITTHTFWDIYVAYKVPLAAHLKKPFAVATAFIALFVLALASKRIDIRIQKK